MLEVTTCILIISFSTGVLYGMAVASRQVASIWLMGLWALLMFGAAGVLIFVYSRAGRYRTGLKGEELIGQVLDGLRRDGAEIFHGLFPADARIGDIDHVLIHPAGVFVIETKMKTGGRTKEMPLVRVVDGVVQSKFGDPCQQAKRSAIWLSQKIEDATGKRQFVTPIVVFPGCRILATGKMGTPVLNGQGLVDYLAKRQRRLREGDIRSLARTLAEIATDRSAAII